MSKLLILILLILVLAAIIALRYRRQIQTALYIWRMFRKMRQMDKPPEKQIEKEENAKDFQLIRCAKCGTWIPQKKCSESALKDVLLLRFIKFVDWVGF